MHRHSHIHRLLNRRDDWTLWERWLLATTIAELVGFGVVVAIGITSSRAGAMSSHTLLFVIGMLEGLILGFFQWLVLRHYIRHITGWITATTVGAFIAWLLGLMISGFMAIAFATSAKGISTSAFLQGIALLGAGVGLILGFAQWLVLRMHIRSAAWWIAANGIAWSLGLLAAFAGTGIITDGLSLQNALARAATGAIMGAVIGAITGIALVWLLDRRPAKRS